MMKSIGIKKEINIVPTGLELERFKRYNKEHTNQIKEKYGLSDHFNLISLGRLAEEKSLDLIINAMPEIIQRNPNIRLFIIGDGPAKNTLMQLTHDLKMDDYIRFAGCQSADVIPDFYYSGDLFVSASLTETQGLTFIEAMASSLPVLARYDSNLDPVIVEGGNGHFFYTQEEYIKKVIELSHKDLTPYKEYAAKHAQQFDSHTFYKGVMHVYNSSIDHFENCFVVSSIKPHEKLVSVEFVSGKRKIALECTIEDVETFHLAIQTRVNQEVIDILKEKQNIRHLYFKAVKLLSYHDYCFHDLKKRLETYGDYNEIEIMKCMALLTDRHLIDDRKYVRSHIDATLKKGKGLKRALIDLKNKDISEHLIEEEIEKFDESEEIEYAFNIVDQLYSNNRKLSPQGLIQKIKRTLYNKGYSENTILSVMNSYDFEFSHERTLSLLKQECEKTYKRYQNKYHDQELKMRISRFKGKFNRKKRFGKSIKNRCPSGFQAAVEQKFKVSGGIYIEVSNDYRASQYDHTVDDYIKKKLSDRMYKLQDGTEVQRDWYSSFLLYCYDYRTKNIDKNKCISEFDKCYSKEKALIEWIKVNEIKVLNSGIKIA